MAHTNAWDETTPLGSENASTADNYLRQHRLDLGERLGAILYGFNASSNAVPENDYGIKSLRCYNQATTPSTPSTDYALIYVKNVSGVPELCYLDDEGNELQMTSGGNLKSTNNLVIDGTSTLTGNVDMAGTLDIGSSTAVDGVLDDDTMAADSATDLATQQSIKAYIDALVGEDYRLVDVNGSPVKVYTKYLTGASLGGSSPKTIAHNISDALTKILFVSANAFEDQNSVFGAMDYKIASPANGNTGFRTTWDATNVSITEIGINVLNNAYRIKIDYIL